MYNSLLGNIVSYILLVATWLQSVALSRCKIVLVTMSTISNKLERLFVAIEVVTLALNLRLLEIHLCQVLSGLQMWFLPLHLTVCICIFPIDAFKLMLTQQFCRFLVEQRNLVVSAHTLRPKFSPGHIYSACFHFFLWFCNHLNGIQMSKFFQYLISDPFPFHLKCVQNFV